MNAPKVTKSKKLFKATLLPLSPLYRNAEQERSAKLLGNEIREE